MMTEMAVTGGTQNATDVHPSHLFVPSASVKSQRVATEPATLQARDGTPADHGALAVGASTVPK